MSGTRASRGEVPLSEPRSSSMSGAATRVRRTGVCAVAVIAGLAAAVTGAVPARAQSGADVVVSPADLHGWQVLTNATDSFPYNGSVNPQSTASYRFRNGPDTPPAGTGSLLMEAGDAPNSRVAAVAPVLAGSALDSVAAVGYSTYVTQIGVYGEAQPITFKIGIRPELAPFGLTFSTLVFEPRTQTLQRPEAGRWQTWNALSGDWWASGVPAGETCAANRLCSWTELKALMGNDSHIWGAYFEHGASGTAFVGAAGALDRVVINGTTYDMENGPATLYVSNQGDDTSPCTETSPCRTINHAIAQANPAGGDTIRVEAGTYNENVTVDRPVTLLGAQAGVDARTRSGPETVITPNRAIEITAGNVELNGFTIEGATEAGVRTSGSQSGYLITNNVFQNNPVGLHFGSSGSAQSIVRSNLFRNNNSPGAISGYGIYSDQGLSDAVIDSNTFENNRQASVAVLGPSSLMRAAANSGITIKGNTADSGVILQGVQTAALEGNTLSSAGGAAIDLLGGNDGVTISGNNLTNSSVGIRLSGSGGPNSGVVATGNNIIGNGIGIEVEPGGSTGTVDAGGNFFHGNDEDAAGDVDISGRLPAPPEFATSTSLAVAPRQQKQGHPVTLTASVLACPNQGGGPGAGEVAFHTDGTELGAVQLEHGVATLTVRDLQAGRHVITAGYLGNDECYASTSRGVTVTVVPKSYPAPPTRPSAPRRPVVPAVRISRVPVTG